MKKILLILICACSVVVIAQDEMDELDFTEESLSDDRPVASAEPEPVLKETDIPKANEIPATSVEEVYPEATLPPECKCQCLTKGLTPRNNKYWIGEIVDDKCVCACLSKK